MEWGLSSFIYFFLLSLLTALIYSLFREKSSTISYKLPPGPPGLPIVGNFFDLGSVPYLKITEMKQKYGPVLWLKIGSINTMVVQTSEAASELFKNHDIVFADRSLVDVNLVCDYPRASMALSPYGTFWRMLRRICTMEMFINKRINETVEIRRKSVDTMLLWMGNEADKVKKGEGIEVARFVFLASFNMLGNLMLSRDLVDPESKKASEFFTAMNGLMEYGAHPNISDVFPCLRWFDLQGLRRKTERDMRKVIDIAAEFLKERMTEVREGEEKSRDFLDVLLQFEGIELKDEPAKLSEHEITIFILEIFLAGTETTSSTVEWALAELLRNPESLSKAKEEILKVVDKKFEENDIDKLPYMQAVIKETLRLHPPLPFLVPRKATEDTEFMGYHIPKGTKVFVNAWAIGRDPECWKDPLDFKPERFLSSKIDFKGQNFELIPFGAGRRMCVGLPLANRMIYLVFGSLLHEFDWKLPENVTPKSLDMIEKMGSAVRKLQPLKAIPKRSRNISGCY